MKKRNYRAQKVNEIRWKEVADRVKERTVVWAIDVAKVEQYGVLPAMEPPERSMWLCGTYHPLCESLAVDGAICTLVDAITTANNDQPTGGCTSGADTLVLPAQSTLTEVNNYICCSNAVRQYHSATRFATPAAPYWPVRTRLAPQ